jgi:hypothetical protein
LDEAIVTRAGDQYRRKANDSKEQGKQGDKNGHGKFPFV